MKLRGLSMYWFIWIHFSVGVVLGTENSTATDLAYQFNLVPPDREVTHLEDEKYFVSCQVGIKTRLRWFDPQMQPIESNIPGDGFYVVDHGNESTLVFTSISLKHNGTWICEAEEDYRRIAFKMTVYSKKYSLITYMCHHFVLSFFQSQLYSRKRQWFKVWKNMTMRS